LWPAPGSGVLEPVSWLWLGLLTLLAAILRLVGLNQQLWFDEIVTLLDSARAPFVRIVTQYDLQNQHTLYSILAHLSIRLLGEQPWTLRLPAALFGIASIPALYFFVRLIASNREALLASALMAVNYQHIWFSQNARGYTAMVFITLISSVFFIRCGRDGKTRDWAMYGVAAALGVYCHLTMAFVVVGHALVYVALLPRARRGSRWQRSHLLPLYGLVLSGILSFLLYSPIIVSVFARTIASSSHSTATEWTSPLWAVKEAVRGLSSGSSGGMAALAIGGLVLLAGLIGYWRQSRFLVGLMLLPALVTAAAVLAEHHNLWPRFFFFEIGFGLLFLVRGAMVCGAIMAGILRSSEGLGVRIGVGLALLMLLASVPPLRANYLYPKQDYLGVMSFVESQHQPGEAIVTAGPVATPFKTYYGRSWTPVETRGQLDDILRAQPATWLIYASPTALRVIQPDIWDAIQTRFKTVRVFPGTLKGGEIYVCKSNAADEKHQQ
jgi:uncharacterized membrane protein